MLNALYSPFMQKAIITGLSVSILSGVISVFIVLRRMSFIGSGISHAAFGGVASGFFLGLNPLISALIYTIAIALGIDATTKKGRISEDVSIGIFYSVSMAIGIALVSLSKSYNVDLFGYLFGNILAVTEEDIIVTLITSATVILIMALFIKEFFLITYNEELAQISGINVKFLNSLFLIMLSVSIVIAIKVTGIIMVSALLVIPGAIARIFARSLFSMIFISSFFSALSVIFGLFLSYEYDIAPGAGIVLTAAAIFFLSLALNKKM